MGGGVPLWGPHPCWTGRLLPRATGAAGLPAPQEQHSGDRRPVGRWGSAGWPEHLPGGTIQRVRPPSCLGFCSPHMGPSEWMLPTDGRPSLLSLERQLRCHLG